MPQARPDRSVPLRRLRCQSLIFLPIAFFALALMAGEKLTKNPCRPLRKRPRKVSGSGEEPPLPAPTDPDVTVSRYPALLIRRSERANPLPMGEETRRSVEHIVPPPSEPLQGTQPPIFPTSPAFQVGVDALEEGNHRRPVEPAVVLNPAGHDGVQPLCQLAQRKGRAPMDPHGAEFGTFGLERLGGHRRQKARKDAPVRAVPRPSCPKGESEEGE